MRSNTVIIGVFLLAQPLYGMQDNKKRKLLRKSFSENSFLVPHSYNDSREKKPKNDLNSRKIVATIAIYQSHDPLRAYSKQNTPPYCDGTQDSDGSYEEIVYGFENQFSIHTPNSEEQQNQHTLFLAEKALESSTSEYDSDFDDSDCSDDSF